VAGADARRIDRRRITPRRGVRGVVNYTRVVIVWLLVLAALFAFQQYFA
jgi:hypothetical protein